MPLEDDPATTPTVKVTGGDATAGPTPPVGATTATALSTVSERSPRAPADNRRGARLGRYVLRERLGAGGMGEVYAAYDPELDRKVAVKLLHRDLGAQATDRLRREARTMARLSHRNLVAVHDVGEHDGQLFLAMELVEGSTLRSWTRGRPWREVLRAYLDAGRGLAAAHEAGVVHRDFKPENVLRGNDGRTAVTDFGIARRRAQHAEPNDAGAGAAIADPSLTRTGAMIGTPLYMAPEQLDGAVADSRSDQFAFALALWEALHGEHPLVPPGADLGALIDAMRGGEALALPSGPVPARVNKALARALRPDPAARWPSLAALLDELDVLEPRRHAAIAVTVVAAAVAAVSAAVIVLATRGNGGAPPAVAPAPKAGAAAVEAPAPPPPPEPVPLTALGGCAYNPMFLDHDTVVFDLTRDQAVDLWRVDLDGGSPTRLTSTPGWEWRAARGAGANELVFIHQDERNATIERHDLVRGTTERLLPVAGAIVHARGVYYFAPTTEPALRTLRGTRDEIFLELPREQGVDTIAVSPDERRLALLLATAQTAPQLCTVALDQPKLVCSQARPTVSRPAFSARGDAVYVNEAAGIARVELAGDVVTTVVPGAEARGGLALSPSGETLVFSACRTQTTLVNLLGDRARALLDDDQVIYPTIGSDGSMAFVHADKNRHTLKIVDTQGKIRELVTRDEAKLSGLSLSNDGQRLVFVMAHATEPGIYATRTTPGNAANRLTEDPGDESPVSLGDEVLFSRRSADGVPTLMRMKHDGSEVRVASRKPRLAVAFDRARARVLLSSPARDFLYWWDPVTGGEIAGPPLPDDYRDRWMSLSPDGRWLLVLSGANGNAIYRVDLRAAKPALERVELLAEDLTAMGGLIDDRGHPLIALRRWAGELWKVPAPAGRPW